MKIKNLSVLIACATVFLNATEQLPTQTESYVKWKKNFQEIYENTEQTWAEKSDFDWVLRQTSQQLSLGAVKPFERFVYACNKRERETNSTHIALYHGRSLMSLIWLDMNKAIYDKHQQCENTVLGGILKNMVIAYKSAFAINTDLFNNDREKFVFLRDHQQAINGTIRDLPPANELYDETGEAGEFYDGRLRSHLLSVSLNPLVDYSENSAFYYFMNNASCHFSIQELQDAMKRHGFTDEYIQSLKALYKTLFKKEIHGCMTQLLIPNNIAQECVYLSKHMGTPYDKDCQESFKRIGGKVFEGNIVRLVHKIKTQQFVYRDDLPLPEYSYPQARIMLTSKYFADPNSGIKMYHHCPVNPDRAREFNMQKRAILGQMHRENKSSAIGKMLNVLKK